MTEHANGELINKSAAPSDLRDTRLVILAVYGMGGPTCAMRVRDALLMVTGVVDAEVQRKLGLAEVIVKTTSMAAGALVQAVAQVDVGGRHAYFARALSGG